MVTDRQCGPDELKAFHGPRVGRTAAHAFRATRAVTTWTVSSSSEIRSILLLTIRLKQFLRHIMFQAAFCATSRKPPRAQKSPSTQKSYLFNQQRGISTSFPKITKRRITSSWSCRESSLPSSLNSQLKVDFLKKHGPHPQRGEVSTMWNCCRPQSRPSPPCWDQGKESAPAAGSLGAVHIPSPLIQTLPGSAADTTVQANLSLIVPWTATSEWWQWQQ